MGKQTDIRIVDIQLALEKVPFRTPLKFGGRVMDGFTLIDVDVVVENRHGKHANGFGSMPAAAVWAWPSNTVEVEQATNAMIELAKEAVRLFEAYPEYGHPLEIVYHLSAEYDYMARRLSERLKLNEPMPVLAQLVATSPIDAALHDAYGRVNEVHSYAALSEQFVNYDLSEYLDEQFKNEYLDKYILPEPRKRLPLYHLVGALDPLTDADLQERVNDGLPETLFEWILADNLTHLKIKLAGDDLQWDVERVLAVDRVAGEAQAQRKCTQWFYSLDFNEKCENVDYVLEFLDRIQQANPAAYDRIQYIEQPTHRDLEAHPENKMHKAAERKPVVIDESLTDFDALLLAREMGYSGVALKTCKGHSESLCLAAAAQKFNMFLCVQDLTLPGYAFLHSASLAAHIPTVAAIEGNGRQYCPSANQKWAKMFPSMFTVQDGTIETGVLNGLGLGF